MKRFKRFALSTMLLAACVAPQPCHAQLLNPFKSSQDRPDGTESGSGVSYYSGYMQTPLFKPPGDAASQNGPATIQPPAPALGAPGPASLAPQAPSAGPTQFGPQQPSGPLPLPGLPVVPPALKLEGAQAGPGAPLAMRGIVDLKPAPMEQTDMAFPINLAAALKLADARPLVISAAQASAWVAEAQLQHAKLLWVPTFNAGGDYVRHDGFGPDFNRGLNTAARPLSQSVNFLYSGIGLTQDVAMTDAIFTPLASRQVLNSKRWDIQSAKNNALLMTTNAYFDVHQYRGQYAAAIDVVQRGNKLVERIGFLSHDLVPKVEVDRAIRMLADMEQHAVSARQMWRVSSADLTQVLRLDPRVMVVPQEHDHLQVTIIDPKRPLEELVPIGLLNRPELASQQAIVKSVAYQIRQERGRILMPSLMMNGFQTPNELIEFGAQGIGAGRKLNLWSLRDDLSPQVLYQWDAMGLGNMARIKEQRGLQSQQIVELFKIQDGVAADVVRAQARLQSAAVRVVQADRSMREALITFEGNYEGLAQTKRFGNVLVQVYRPQEAVIALEHLLVAYDQYFSTVADYNRAQFELFHALGYPAKEVAALNPPGQEVPVDTSRPSYLPAVGVGPPPATR